MATATRQLRHGWFKGFQRACFDLLVGFRPGFGVVTVGLNSWDCDHAPTPPNLRIPCIQKKDPRKYQMSTLKTRLSGVGYHSCGALNHQASEGTFTSKSFQDFKTTMVNVENREHIRVPGRKKSLCCR